nr:MAG TPA: hypothetical protein [Caudoviricetes sp.]
MRFVLHRPPNMEIGERGRRAEYDIFNRTIVFDGIDRTFLHSRQLCLSVEFYSERRRRLHLNAENIRFRTAPLKVGEVALNCRADIRQNVLTSRVCGRRHKGKFTIDRTAHVKTSFLRPDTAQSLLRVARVHFFNDGDEIALRILCSLTQLVQLNHNVASHIGASALVCLGISLCNHFLVAFAEVRVDLQHLIAELDHLCKRLLIQQLAILIVNAKDFTFLICQAGHDNEPAFLEEVPVELREHSGQILLGNIEASGFASDLTIQAAFTEENRIVFRNFGLPEELHHFRITRYLHDLRHDCGLRLEISSCFCNRFRNHLLDICHRKGRFFCNRSFLWNFHSLAFQRGGQSSQRRFAAIVADSDHVFCVNSQNVIFARCCFLRSVGRLILFRDIEKSDFFLDFLCYRCLLRSSGFLSSVLAFSHIAHSFQILWLFLHKCWLRSDSNRLLQHHAKPYGAGRAGGKTRPAKGGTLKS